MSETDLYAQIIDAAADAHLALLVRLQREHPEIEIELVASNKLTNLLRREADIAVRMVRPAQQSLIARKLGEIEIVAAAHKSYLAKAPPLRVPEDLVAHRLIGFDRHLEEAAMDLGANELTTFTKVTLPLIAPAILASLALTFAISIDDFVVTYFNAGNQVTFPLFVWGAARVGAPPQVNVIGTAIFVIALTAMLVNVLVQMRRSKGAT